MVEPALSTMRGGILLTSRITSGVVRNFAAMVSIRSRAVVTLCAVHEDSACVHLPRLDLNFSALLLGSRICVSALPMMTGLLNCGLSALNSSIGSSASLAATCTSMSRVFLIVTK